MSKFCTNCGEALEPDNKWCTKCGTEIGVPLSKTKATKFKAGRYTGIIFLSCIVFFTIISYPSFYDYPFQEALLFAFYTSLLISSYIAIFFYSASKFSKYSILGKIFFVSFWALSIIVFLALFAALRDINLFYRVLISVIIATVLVLVSSIIGFAISSAQDAHVDFK